MVLDLEVIKKFLLNAIFGIAAFFITVLPSLFSRYSYSHSDAPKEFAVIMFSSICGFLLCFYVIADFFSGPDNKSKTGASKTLIHYIAMFFYLFTLSLVPSMLSSLVPLCSGYILLLQFSFAAWFLFFYVCLYGNTINRVEIFLKSILISGIFPALIMILEISGISISNIWQNTELTGVHSGMNFISTFGTGDFSAPFFGFLCLLNIRFIIYSDESKNKVPYWILQIIYLFAFFGPLGRSSIIAFMVSGAFYFLVSYKFSKEKTSDFINMAILIVIVFFACQLKDMLFSSDATLITRLKSLFFNTDSIYERFYMLNVGAAIIYDNLWTGAGAGTLLAVFPLYARNIAEISPFINSVSPSFNTYHLNNEFFNIFAEYGIFSLIFYVLTLTSAIYFLLRPVFKKGLKFELNLIAAVLILFLIVDSLFNVTLSGVPLKFLFVFLLALAAVLSLNSGDNFGFKLKFSGKFISPIICIMLFSFFALSEITGVKCFLADWYLMQGRILELMNYQNEAVNCYSNSIILFAGKAEPFYYRALLNEKYGNFEKSIDDLKAASNINLSLPVAYKLAQIAVNHLDLNSQLRYILFLTKAYPKFDEAHYMLGMRYLKESTEKPEVLENALKSFEKTISINPKHIKAIIKAAEICYESRKFYRCDDFLNKALEIEPQNERVLYLKNLCRGFFY